MKTLQCILMRNDCFAKYHGVRFAPSGVVVHSTDKAGKVISRFVQPYAGQVEGLMINGKPVSETEMRAVLGKNKYSNDWNRPGVEKAVHAMLGTLADGSYGVCQTLPWDMPCWGCGSGKNGSYNGCCGGKAAEPLYVQFEMIEDSEGDPVHATNLYWNAVEFCAELMRLFPTILPENVVSHKEAHKRGFASDHGDPENYWKRCGKDYTMAQFRADVQARLNGPQPEPEPLPRYVTAEEARAIVREELEAVLGPWIERIDDIPHKSVAAEVRMLLDCGAINGGTSADKDPDDIRLPYNIVRSLVMAKRYTDTAVAEKG